MADATNTVEDLGPDRASFSIALATVQDTLIQAAKTTVGAEDDLAGRSA